MGLSLSISFLACSITTHSNMFTPCCFPHHEVSILHACPMTGTWTSKLWPQYTSFLYSPTQSFHHCHKKLKTRNLSKAMRKVYFSLLKQSALAVWISMFVFIIIYMGSYEFPIIRLKFLALSSYKLWGQLWSIFHPHIQKNNPWIPLGVWGLL